MKINQLKAGAALSYGSMILGFVISIVYTPVMLRLLGQSEYGLYNLVSSVVSYLGILSFGFGSAYMRYYSRYKIKDDKDGIARLNGMYLIVFTIIGVVAVIAGSVLAANIDWVLGDKLTVDELGKAKILMIILVVNLSLSFPASVFNSYITANEEFIFQKLLQIVKHVLGPLVMLPVLLMGFKSVGMVVVTTSINIAIEAWQIIFCFSKLKIRFNFRGFNFGLAKEIAVFSFYIFINMIIDQINWSVDKFIIGRFRGTAEVAVYGLAAQLNTYYLSISTAVSNVFIPRVNQMVAKSESDKELTNLFTRIGRIQFIILSLICTGLVFFGRPFIRFWAGANYSDSYPIALLLIIPVTIPLIQNLGIEIQKAKNMHKFRSLVYLGIALTNTIASIFLTKYFGGIGAAAGTAITLLLGNGLIMNLYYHNKVGINIRYFWKQIARFIPSLIAPAIAGILIVKFIEINDIIKLLVFGTIYVCVFGVSIWFIGMNRYEKDLIKKPAQRVIKKCRLVKQ